MRQFTIFQGFRKEWKIIETKYEVIRFIEHGTRCRSSMDSVTGELLIYRVRDNPQITKEQLFAWFEQLLEQLIQYHRCYEDQNYKYINPYSVLVARDGKLLLLDLDAESNGFVMRNLQKRAMRAHFVKPVVHIMESSGNQLDLYGYGKTIQFILANTNVEPSLSKFQENKLERIINKCLNESKGKQYKELKEVKKELPVIHDKIHWKVKKDWIVAIVSVIGILAAGYSCFSAHRLKQKQEYMANWIWEMEQQLETEKDKPDIDINEIQERINNIEEEVLEEVHEVQASIQSVNELLDQHLSEIEEKEEIDDQSSEEENQETVVEVESESELTE